MKNQFVPYEIAFVLKEKGFDEPCLALYDSHKTLLLGNKPEYLISNEKANYIFGNDKVTVILAPLWQQVIEWFRAKHDIHIDNDNNYSMESYWWRNGSDSGFKEKVRTKKFSCTINRGEFQTKYYETYHEALSQAIEHVLTLI